MEIERKYLIIHIPFDIAGYPFHQIEQEGEMVTPTGAAIAALSEGQIPAAYCVKKVGMGAGKREYQNTNILRAMLIEEK